MANRDRHRRFGNVRRRESGRYQIRYPGPDARMRTGPETYERRSDADRALVMIEAQIRSGEWTDPERGKVKLGDYGSAWITERPGLRPRTMDLYRWLLRKHIEPYLGGVPVGKLSTRQIREWRATLLANGVSVSVTAKAYRLLRAILTTAVDDDKLLPRNPCRIRGAGTEDAAERPVLTVAQVFELAGQVGRRPAAASAQSGPMHVIYIELSTGEMLLGPPKSRAGRRIVGLPEVIVPTLREHLAVFAEDDPGALVSPGAKGGPLRRGNFNKMSAWPHAVESIGMPGLHFHDLRQAGNQFAAYSGARLRDLMARDWSGQTSQRVA